LIAGIAAEAIVMRIRIRPDKIEFTLQVEVQQAEGIDVMTAELNGKLVGPPSITAADVVDDKFIQHKLPVKRQTLHRIPFEIKPQQDVVRTSVLLFDRAEENDGIQVFKPEVIRAEAVVGAEDHRFKNTEIEFLADVDAQVMRRDILVRVAAKNSVARGPRVRNHLVDEKKVIQLPHFHVALEKKRRRRVVGDDQ